MQEIVFGTSEEELREAVLRRRKLSDRMGHLGIPCSKCGGYLNVIPNADLLISECEECFKKRWVEENFLKDYKEQK